MHPITVRAMKFAVPDPGEYDPVYLAGSAAISYTHTAFGLFVALCEPFFVKSLRRVVDGIKDDKLREDVDRFARQEAQHYQRHADFNKTVLAQGYPGIEQRMETLRREFDDWLDRRTDRFRVGYMEGFESYTTQFALQMIDSGLYDHRRTHPSFGELFKWHLLEEIEHRNVAFDVYQHLYGDYLYRARMCWFAQSHMVRFMNDCARIMSDFDIKRHGERCRIRRRPRVVMSINRARMRAQSMLPGYTPHAYRLPPSIGELSALFTQRAESVR
jgi:predicted metal-dependent hydrolase